MKLGRTQKRKGGDFGTIILGGLLASYLVYAKEARRRTIEGSTDTSTAGFRRAGRRDGRRGLYFFHLTGLRRVDKGDVVVGAALRK